MTKTCSNGDSIRYSLGQGNNRLRPQYIVKMKNIVHLVIVNVLEHNDNILVTSISDQGQYESATIATISS